MSTLITSHPATFVPVYLMDELQQKWIVRLAQFLSEVEYAGSLGYTDIQNLARTADGVNRILITDEERDYLNMAREQYIKYYKG